MPIKVALVAAKMSNFADDSRQLGGRYLESLRALESSLGFTLLPMQRLVATREDAVLIRKELEAADVDFVLLLHSTFILGDITFELLASRLRFGFWGIEEPAQNGALPWASFVGLNQNMSIARHFFPGRETRCKWFFGPVEGDLFLPRFRVTLQALRALKALRHSRVGLVGDIAPGFRNMCFDERALFAALGVDVVRGVTVGDVLQEAERLGAADVQQQLATAAAIPLSGQVDQESLQWSVRVKMAMEGIARRQQWDALAVSCWPKFQDPRQHWPCTAVAALNQEGLPAACEGDVLSAISMLILRHLTGQPNTVLDMAAFDCADQSVLLWHCGPTPACLANDRGVTYDAHYRFPGCGLVNDLTIKPSPVTVFRLTGNGDRYYYFTGHTLAHEKKSFQGSRGWIAELQWHKEPISVIDLVNTILVNGLQHHYPLTLSDVSDALDELAAWLGLARVPRTPYADHLPPS